MLVFIRPCLLCRLVLELAKLGSMFDLVVTRREFSEPRDLPRLLRMMAGAAAGLLHLHACKPPIIHRDIALRNLFVTADHQVKVKSALFAPSSKCTGWRLGPGAFFAIG